MKAGTGGALDVLVFGSHPDDVEISCGGTVALLVKKGRKVGIVDLTRGERGTEGSKAIREKEAGEAARVLGVSVRDNAGIADTQIFNNHENRKVIVRLVRKYRPRVVILPINDNRHPDHINCETLVKESCYLAGLRNYDCDLEPHRPFKILRPHSFRSWIKPTYIVDITPTFKLKMKSIEAFASQFPKDSKRELRGLRIGRIPEFVEIRARFYGLIIGKEYGEAFIQDEVQELDDPCELAVASM